MGLKGSPGYGACHQPDNLPENLAGRGLMFERYTEKARRVIFFARYEASQYGSPYIETEHLLLGLMRDDQALANCFLREEGSIESIRKEIEARITIREHISTSVEVPLSAECKRILNMAGGGTKRPRGG